MKRYQNIYFLGIGGIGMSALARYFLHEGCRVAGYDRTESHLTDELSREGAVITYEDGVENIPEAFRDPSTTMAALADDRGHGRYAASRLGFREQDAYEDEDGYEEDYEEYEDEEMDPRDVIAEKIIRWAPPITAVLCAIVALIGFLLA